MSVVATGAGHFLIPTAPAGGTSVTSGTANTFTGTAIVLSASTSAIYITGVHVESSAALAATYVCVQLMQGGAGSETAIGQYLVPLSTGSTVALGFCEIWPPLKVAASTRLSVKTADSVGSKATLITVQCILQSNVVDDGIAVGTVTTVGSVTGGVTVTTNNDKTGYTASTVSDKTGYSLTQTFPSNFSALGISAAGKINEVVLTDTLTTYTGNTVQTGDAYARIGAAGAGLTALGDTRIAHLDADVSSRLAPAGTLATVTNLTNAPGAGDFTAAMKTSLNAATPASVTGAVGSVSAAVTVGTNNDKTGYALSASGLSAIWTTQLTESYAAKGTVPTLAQILFESRALQAEKAVATTTLTTNKIDGVTAAATYTLNDATSPTAITRAT